MIDEVFNPQMMAAGNPNNWWSINSNGMHHPQSSQELSSSSSYLSSSPSSHSPYPFGSSSSSLTDHQPHHQELPRSWSQLLLGGLPTNDEDQRFVGTNTNHCQYNRMENWEEHVLNPPRFPLINDVKQELSQNSQLYGHVNEEYQASRHSWPPVNFLSSPRSSCVTSLSTNSLLNFSTTKPERRNQPSDHSTEGNSSSSGGLAKKPRVQHSSTQPALKVRKEKLGDRITALHQLVSPFGKTDTASVLSEAIGYIRFLLGQIEALSTPYLGNVSKSMGHQHSFLDNNCLKRSEASKQDGQNRPRDLKSRGLCLVPISCTLHVGNDNGADYWAPALGGGF